MHATFIDVFLKVGWFLKDNCQTLATFVSLFPSAEALEDKRRSEEDKLFVSNLTHFTTILWEAELLVTKNLLGRGQNVKVLHKTEKVIVRTLYRCALTTFFFRIGSRFTRNILCYWHCTAEIYLGLNIFHQLHAFLRRKDPAYEVWEIFIVISVL